MKKDVTNDISFTYSVPKKQVPPGGKFLTKPNPPALYAQLVADVQAAAQAAMARSTALGMPLSEVKISVAFGAKNDGSASLNIPVSLVTLGPSGDYSKNEIQTLTLTFSNPAGPVGAR